MTMQAKMLELYLPLSRPISHISHISPDLTLQAEMLELRAAPDGPAEGTVLESVMGKGLGILSTVPPAVARLSSPPRSTSGGSCGKEITVG